MTIQKNTKTGGKLLRLAAALAACASLCACSAFTSPVPEMPGPEPSLPAETGQAETALEKPSTEQEDGIPVFDGEHIAVELDASGTGFTQEQKDAAPGTMELSPLDSLGRAGPVFLAAGPETLPAAGEKRGSIGQIRPSGWHTVRYDELISDRYLYNRCHLAAWMLSRCNDPCNLITGTRAMNLAMVPYETRVADHIRATGGHVLYRAVPVFFEDELVCRGIRLEAMSLEDGGAGLHFNVFFHNVQPGIGIDYRTGDSRLLEAAALPGEEDHEHEQTFIINESSKKFHTDSCPNAERIAPHNRRVVQDTRAGLKAQGYHDAGCCLDTGH